MEIRKQSIPGTGSVPGFLWKEYLPTTFQKLREMFGIDNGCAGMGVGGVWGVVRFWKRSGRVGAQTVCGDALASLCIRNQARNALFVPNRPRHPFTKCPQRPLAFHDRGRDAEGRAIARKEWQHICHLRRRSVRMLMWKAWCWLWVGCVRLIAAPTCARSIAPSAS